MTWVSVHTHTTYSLLDSASRIPDLVGRAVELGMPALGISDHGNLHGAYEFWKECNSQGIKPLIGIEAYCAPESRHTKTPVYWGTPEQKREDVDNQGAYTHMLLIAQNATGLRNLYKLHELSYTEGFYRKPRLDLELLEQYNEGVIATTGCVSGAVPTLLRLGLKGRAEDYLINLENIFPGRLYVELMWHGCDFDDQLTEDLIELAKTVDLPLLATNDSHATHPHEVRVQGALLALQKRPEFSGAGYWLKSYEEMRELPLPTVSITNTLLLADSVEPYDDVFRKRNLMPRMSDNMDLRTACYNTNAVDTPEMIARLEYELDVIEGMGYEDYFLVLSDIVRWARGQRILVGPGRGSAGGSLVAYLLGITELNPLVHGLLFERFLNPQRISTPDIDVDFQDDRRDEVIAYAAQKYGADRVAQIVTFGTIKAKAALKDANRVMGGTYSEGERLVGLVPEPVAGKDHPLAGLNKVRQANPEVYELATGLEGLVRNTGKHAAGVIISPEPLSDIIPVKKDKDDTVLTAAYDQGTLEAHGLVKYDFLGLKELRIIQKTLEITDAEA